MYYLIVRFSDYYAWCERKVPSVSRWAVRSITALCFVVHVVTLFSGNLAVYFGVGAVSLPLVVFLYAHETYTRKEDRIRQAQMASVLRVKSKLDQNGK